MEIINEIFKKITYYETGTDYTPLKVTLDIDSPIYITSPFINFDGIIQYLCMRDALEDLFYILPSNAFLDLRALNLPLKKTEDVFHTSVSLFNQAKLYKDTVYKRFTDKEIDCVNPKKYKKVRVGSGYYKGFMINLPALLSDTVTFYCNGDKESLKYLLSNLTHIGKKPSIGGGHISKISIDEIEADYSFYKDEKIMRPIPTKLKMPVVPGMQIQRQSYKPPYWDKANIDMCYVPNSQISTL